jgi:hypothetical protein
MMDSHCEQKTGRQRSNVDIVYDILVSEMGRGAKNTF